MFKRVRLDGEIFGVYPNRYFIDEVFDYLEKVSLYVPVLWFGSRVELHISKDFVLKGGYNHKYSLRINQYEIFIELDKIILESIKNSTAVAFLSQNEVFNFDFEFDLMRCEQLFWSD